MAHQSDSALQREAENLIVKELANELGASLSKRRVELPGGAKVELDAASEDNSVFVEAFAHQGAFKGGQRAKVARDAFKLATLGRVYPKARLIIAVADQVAAKTLGGKSWLSEAIKTWQIEVITVDVGKKTRAQLVARQQEQRMVNPILDEQVEDEPL